MKETPSWKRTHFNTKVTHAAQFHGLLDKPARTESQNVQLCSNKSCHVAEVNTQQHVYEGISSLLSVLYDNNFSFNQAQTLKALEWRVCGCVVVMGGAWMLHIRIDTAHLVLLFRCVCMCETKVCTEQPRYSMQQTHKAWFWEILG